MVEARSFVCWSREKREGRLRKPGIDRAADYKGACMPFAFTLHKVVT